MSPIFTLLNSLLVLYIIWYFLLRPTKFVKTSNNSSHPPVITGYLPWIGCGLSFIFGPPKGYLQQIRQQIGDTFILYMFGRPFLYVFSSSGIKSLYTLRENDASFAEATKGLLGLKLPSQVLDGSMKKFHTGLRKNLLQTYLNYIANAVEKEFSILKQKESNNSTFEIFYQMRFIVHRIGFACWIGSECTNEKYLSRLIQQFDTLDPEVGFKSLKSLAKTTFTMKAAEKQAIKSMGEILKEIWINRLQRRQQIGNNKLDEDNLDNIIQIASEESKENEEEKWIKVACSVIQFHVASQANLYAAISWTLISFLLYPKAKLQKYKELIDKKIINFTNLEEVEGNELLKEMDSIIQESLRLSQQSITLRKVLKECNMKIDDIGGEIILPIGLYVSTLLSITNVDEKYFGENNNQTSNNNSSTSSSSRYPIHEFHPERYQYGNLDDKLYQGDCRYNISTFGHGYHACPGYNFSMMTIKYVICKFIEQFDMKPMFDEAKMPPESIGAIARATHPCLVTYKSRK